MSEEKKPKRVKPVAKEPTTQAEFTVRAGKVQGAVNRITANRDKAHLTATARIDKKYRAMLEEEILGLHDEVISRLVLPSYAYDAIDAEFVDIGADLNEAVAAE